MLTSPPDDAELERARSRHDDVVRRARQIKRRRSAAVGAALVAIAVVALALPFTATHGAGDGRQVVTTSPPPPPSSLAPTTTADRSTRSTRSTPTTLAAPLARGQEAPRSAIPWSQVGPGWTMALWSPEPAPSPGVTTGVAPAATETLYLVNPIGGRYAVATVPTGLVVEDWSATGRVALLGSYGSSLETVDLGTGAAHTVSSSSKGRLLTGVLTKPNGQALLVLHQTTSNPATDTLERIGRDGAHQLTYPTDLGQVGTFDGGFLPSADGTELVLGATRGLAMVANDGQVLRPLTIPSGEPGAVFADCEPVRWWDAATLVVQCSGSTGLWLVPTDGSPPRGLTRNETGTVDLGDQDAWRIGSTAYVQALGACGYRYLATVNADGTTTPVEVPGVISGSSVVVIGVTGSRLELQTTVADCGGGQSLVWYDPGARTTEAILGPPLDGGGVTSAVAEQG